MLRSKIAFSTGKFIGLSNTEKTQSEFDKIFENLNYITKEEVAKFVKEITAKKTQNIRRDIVLYSRAQSGYKMPKAWMELEKLLKYKNLFVVMACWLHEKRVQYMNRGIQLPELQWLEAHRLVFISSAFETNQNKL